MKLKINNYSFGRMVVGGREFTSDIIIHPDGHIQNNWRRSQGHNLLIEDITIVLDVAPDKLIIGTGARNMMRVSENVLKVCKDREIEVAVCHTAEAVTVFNDAMEESTIVAACFHLTC